MNMQKIRTKKKIFSIGLIWMNWFSMDIKQEMIKRGQLGSSRPTLRSFFFSGDKQRPFLLDPFFLRCWASLIRACASWTTHRKIKVNSWISRFRHHGFSSNDEKHMVDTASNVKLCRIESQLILRDPNCRFEFNPVLSLTRAPGLSLFSGLAIWIESARTLLR